ncbi:hypothetical protein MIND_01270900 [Mycena indigotica]|uniref:Heme haloperoxidase family profile domain-containing protein n=1 Tax=Mycena indigotica TaxID=2126181 RepID=A0A8H6VTD7_9AGAR|nr:uncharacterized protein MIND_01270900 [Mycena indigotica]KAF7291271.1 hypothetical protein MIND_01270900 [Mycena indigotica]
MLFQGIGHVLLNVRIFVWDLWLTLLNVLLPSLPKAKDDGEKGRWPEWAAPKEGDSRCACPALNAMANHGILPHDGKGVKFTDMAARVHETYNFAPTFAAFVARNGADTLKRDYSKDTFDLAELDLHNGIEHDASLLRQDAYFSPSQSTPHLPLVDALLASASGTAPDGSRALTAADLSAFSSKRRADSKRENPQFVLDKTHAVFGSAKCVSFPNASIADDDVGSSSTLLAIFGGHVPDLEVFLREERLPRAWQSVCRARKGLTFFAFNGTTLKVERGIDEAKYERERAEKEAAPETQGEKEVEQGVN